MATLDVDCNGLVIKTISKKPPKHHTLKIMSFSSLKSEDRFESGYFEAGGYSWKLVLFPNGNKKRNVTDHISLYLEMAGEKPISTGLVVTVDYKLFLLNRQKETKTYLVREDANKKEQKYCFYRTIVGGSAGFDRFISLEDFNNVCNGYLVDDQCEFGAEVFVSEMRKGKGEMVAMNLNTYVQVCLESYRLLKANG
uniref:ubiquitin carboxyl-terminal hydrolase 12-like n=1 Tax=Fragaria vesca subsp. vesca TaxID=101020 RepID=UPI0005CA910D|nr:PREDICTED: ubiquitin carboxyl-terminal hydrolase 12-like [Fragaria vesca subsp. vesca]